MTINTFVKATNVHRYMGNIKNIALSILTFSLDKSAIVSVDRPSISPSLNTSFEMVTR